MKKIILIMICALSMGIVNAQTAKEILDKTASVVNAKKGATANFTMNGVYGDATGTITIKGNKFTANTLQAKVWYDGKTQWTYMKSTQEVNVSTPTEAQQQAMNPYRFINLYNMGYDMSKKDVSSGYEVHLKANNAKRTITEMYITVNKSFVPITVKMKTAKGWTNINISNFKSKTLPDSSFRFNAKDYPKAEVIDLR